MRNYRNTPVTTKDVENVENERVACGAAAMQGWRIRQEDAHFCLPDYDKNVSLFGLFDGHGGVEVARYAVEMLPGMIKKTEEYKRSDYAGALRRAFREFDAMLLRVPAQMRMEKLRRDGNEEHNLVELRDITEPPAYNSGCTAVVALLVGKRLYVANIGDSRCLVGESHKKVFPMTSDHNPTKLKESFRIKKAGGYVSFGGRVNNFINLSRAFGDFMYKSNKKLPVDEQMLIAVPDIRVKLLHPENGDFFVLVCDGIWNAYSNYCIFDFVSQGIIKTPTRPLSDIGESLCDTCQSPCLQFSGEGLDNMSCIIVKFQKDYANAAGKPDNFPAMNGEDEDEEDDWDDFADEDYFGDRDPGDDDTSSLVRTLEFINVY